MVVGGIHGDLGCVWGVGVADILPFLPIVGAIVIVIVWKRGVNGVYLDEYHRVDPHAFPPATPCPLSSCARTPLLSYY